VKRREFITLLGGAAMWPLRARAQQGDRVRRIGVLIGYASSPDDPVTREMRRPFEKAMQDAGWIDGKNIRIDYRFGGGDLAEIKAAAAELVALSPDLIYALGLPAAQAVHEKTHTIPIVFSRVGDPVGFGLVASITRPGGNITGFAVWDFSIGGKWLQLLREIAPQLRRVGIIYNPETGPYAAALIASAKAAAGSDVAVVEYPTHNDQEIEAAASALSQEPHGGLMVVPEPFTNEHRDKIIAQAARSSLPILMSIFAATKRGALISYNYEFDAMMRQPVSYIDRILKGQSPGDLPVQAPTKFELSINLRTAKALGLTVPPALLARADEVIE
jgi:putative ABC transport system substrate-binding protein